MTISREARLLANLLTWGRFAAVIRCFQEHGEGRSYGRQAVAKADHIDAYRQLPVKNDHKMLAVVTLKGPDSGGTKG